MFRAKHYTPMSIFTVLLGYFNVTSSLSAMETYDAYYCRCHNDTLTSLALTTNLFAQ